MKNYFHGGIVMNGFLKHPYFAGTFRNGRNSSQAQKDFVGPGSQEIRRHVRLTGIRKEDDHSPLRNLGMK